MAFENGFYRQEGLDVNYRLFPSGTTAFQTFRTGQGDIVLTGDLPSVQYFFSNHGNYRTFVGDRARRQGLRGGRPQGDQAGRTWSASHRDARRLDRLVVHLRIPAKNGVDPNEGPVKNLDTQVMPAALCKGEIAAFFIWQPIGSRTLEICPTRRTSCPTPPATSRAIWSPARGPEWLTSPDGKEIATRWLRATIKGGKCREGFHRGRRLRRPSST